MKPRHGPNLLERGVPVDDLAARTGWTAKTIRRRLALHGLCNRARAALREGQLSLSQAQALALGTTDQQEELLNRILDGSFWYDAEEIRDILLSERPTVSMALFPLDDYDGTLTEDWFTDDESRYFDDAPQFMRLQRQAVNKLAAAYTDKGAAWVEIDEHRYPRLVEVRQGQEGQQGGRRGDLVRAERQCGDSGGSAQARRGADRHGATRYRGRPPGPSHPVRPVTPSCVSKSAVRNRWRCRRRC